MIDIHVPVFDAFLYFLILAIVFFMFGYGNSLINMTKGFTKEQVDTLEETLRKITEYSYIEVNYDTAHGNAKNGLSGNNQGSQEGLKTIPEPTPR